MAVFNKQSIFIPIIICKKPGEYIFLLIGYNQRIFSTLIYLFTAVTVKNYFPIIFLRWETPHLRNSLITFSRDFP